MKNICTAIIILIGLMFYSSCSNGSKEQQASNEETKSIENYSASADRLPPEELEMALPDAVLGMPKKSGSNGSPKMKNGSDVSMARRVYRDGDREVVFAIYDSGTLGTTMDSYLPWLGKKTNLDNEKMIEKNGSTQGFPSYEKYNKAKQKGELHVLPNKRFEIIVYGTKVSLAELKQILKDWDIANSVSTIK